MTESVDDREAARLQAAISEIGKQAQDFTLSADKYFGLATTTIVATVGLAVAQKLPAALVALPFALGGLLLYVTQLFTERAARMGMRAYLEEALRQRGDFWYANQEACLAHAVSQERPSVRVSTALYGFTYVASCTIGVVAAGRLNTDVPAGLLVSAVSAALLALSAALVVAARELARAYRRAYEFMRDSRLGNGT